MKQPILYLSLITLLISGCASNSLYSAADLNTHVSTAGVFLSVNEGVATLTGSAAGIYERNVIEKATRELEGVVKVRNRLSY